MKKKMALLFLLGAVVVLAPLVVFSSTHPEVGSVAPQFTLPTQDGQPVSLADFKGKWVVLYFYPKDMTSGCTLEAHNFQRDLAQYEQRNAVILGVSVDDVKSHKEFCVKESLSFRLLADTQHTVSEAYGTLSHMPFTHAARNTFLISPEGRVVRVFDSVKPNEHSAEVLAAIDALKGH